MGCAQRRPWRGVGQRAGTVGFKFSGLEMEEVSLGTTYGVME